MGVGVSKLDYVYVLRERDGDPSLVKIGHSFDPLDRLAGYQAGNSRSLVVVFTLLGGQPLEQEIHGLFSQSRVGDGGSEWFKLTAELIEFLQLKMKEALTSDAVLRYSKKVFESPIYIETVEPEEVQPQPVRSASVVGRIQPYSNVEAELPKSAFERMREKG
jgi:hypothetical protein